MLRGAPGTRALTAAGDELAGSMCIEVSPLGHSFGALPNPTGACSLNLPHWGVSGAQEQFQVQSDGLPWGLLGNPPREDLGATY